MGLEFFKYQATGNDFVLIDNRNDAVSPGAYELFADMCHRRFGVGADGVILLQGSPDGDFEMLYYNADGRPGSMCGNGGRSVVRFAQDLGLVKEHSKFIAVDGPHEADLGETIWLKMGAISVIEELGNDAYFLDTGSPHHVEFHAESIDKLDVYQLGKVTRNNEKYAAKGTNVNFVNILADGQLNVRTYERGVEDETYSCGTGVTAVAHVYKEKKGYKGGMVSLQTKGGLLQIDFRSDGIWLGGPAVCVFHGEWHNSSL